MAGGLAAALMRGGAIGVSLAIVASLSAGCASRSAASAAQVASGAPALETTASGPSPVYAARVLVACAARMDAALDLDDAPRFVRFEAAGRSETEIAYLDRAGGMALSLGTSHCALAAATTELEAVAKAAAAALEALGGEVGPVRDFGGFGYGIAVTDAADRRYAATILPTELPIEALPEGAEAPVEGVVIGLVREALQGADVLTSVADASTLASDKTAEGTARHASKSSFSD